MSKSKPTIPICSYCGSDDVKVDAYSAWDTEIQDFVHVSDHENWICEDCDGECGVDWIDLDKFVPKEDDDA